MTLCLNQVIDREINPPSWNLNPKEIYGSSVTDFQQGQISPISILPLHQEYISSTDQTIAQMEYFSMSDFVFTHCGFCSLNDSGT